MICKSWSRLWVAHQCEITRERKRNLIYVPLITENRIWSSKHTTLKRDDLSRGVLAAYLAVHNSVKTLQLHCTARKDALAHSLISHVSLIHLKQTTKRSFDYHNYQIRVVQLCVPKILWNQDQIMKGMCASILSIWLLKVFFEFSWKCPVLYLYISPWKVRNFWNVTVLVLFYHLAVFLDEIGF